MATRKKKQSRVGKLALVDMPADQVRRLLRARTEFAAFMEPMLAYYVENEDALGRGVINPAKVRAAKEADEALGPAEAAALAQLERIRATRLLHRATVWSAELEICARGRVAARTNPALKRGIQAFEQMLKRKKRVAPAAATPSTGTA